MQVNLSDNRICGIWNEYDGRGVQGTYNAEGIKAIADALCVTASLTEVRQARASHFHAQSHIHAHRSIVAPLDR